MGEVTLTEKKHILVVDDDERLRALLEKFLSDQGFLVLSAASADAAASTLDVLAFDLIVLDVMMPGKDGFTFARDLKQAGLDTPILFLTAKGEIRDRIEGLEAGADDYLMKPFEPRELVLRIGAILRRSKRPVVPSVIRFGTFTFDPQKSMLMNEDSHIVLTATESRLLDVFVKRLGETISRDDIATACEMSSDERTIDVQINRLRRKIEKDTKNPRHLQTVRGKGYVLWQD